MENPRDGGAWWAAVYGVAQSWTQLKRFSSSSSIYIYTHIGNSFCYTKETNTKKLYVNKKINKINCLRAEFLGQ